LHKKVSDYLFVHEGLITGDKHAYIFSSEKLPSKDKKYYAPFLPDREIEKYSVPKRTNKYVYYPYKKGKPVPESDLRKDKDTWKYLTSKRENLKKSAQKTWPYLYYVIEEKMMCPKIISPHLVLFPRFALDINGKYAISHAPFLVPKEKEKDIELLKFFAAVLNSSVVHWYLGTHGYRYSRGYLVLEPRYLKEVPVPDPSKISPDKIQKIIRLVDKRIQSGNQNLDKNIDDLVLECYGLSTNEREFLGGGEL